MFINRFGRFRNIECGLISIVRNTPQNSAKIGEPISLESVSVSVSIVDTIAQVDIKQMYINTDKYPIELIYYFPVDSNVTITHFQTEVDGKTIKKMEKSEVEALVNCERAIRQKSIGFPASENTPDVFKVPIGLIKEAYRIEININYADELKIEKGPNSMKFVLPTTIVPRYLPPLQPVYKILTRKSLERFKNTSPGKLSQLSSFILKTCGGNQDASLSSNTDEQPLKTEPTTMTTPKQTPGTVKININLTIQGGVKNVKCPSYKIRQPKDPVSDKSQSSPSPTVVVLNAKTVDMDREFVLLINSPE